MKKLSNLQKDHPKENRTTTPGNDRRDFIKKIGMGSLAISTPMPLLGHLQNDSQLFENDFEKVSFELLVEWCNTLIKYQVNDSNLLGLHGGVLCPACSRIHGRCGDAIYPLLFLAKNTGDKKYLQSALLLFEWMEENVSLPDGSWVNDVNVELWNGTTVFAAIALGEALYNHGDLLSAATKQKWLDRLRKAADFIHRTFHIEYSNVNYPITGSYALYLLGDLFEDDSYREHGKKLARQSLRFITVKDKLIFGEGGGDRYTRGPKGCLPVDLGYNVEESLPSLVLYGIRAGDEVVLSAVKESLKAHMEFMLPDGAWDNSWGTRNFKWTYWGGRTSKGCHGAYVLMANKDPAFYQVALKNVLLLRSCTHGGMLYGGPNYVTHGALPCIHHILGHANSLAVAIEYSDSTLLSKAQAKQAKLPRELSYGIKPFSDIYTWLIANDSWAATVTGYGREYKFKNGHPSGGAMSVLYHRKLGPILASSLNVYQMIESPNMQAQLDPYSTSLTARMQTKDGKYMNISDLNAQIEVEQQGQEIVVNTRSRLLDADQNGPETGNVNYTISYVFKNELVAFQIEHDSHRDDVEFILPIISNSLEKFTKLSNKHYEIKKKGGSVKISADNPIVMKPILEGKTRIFNHVPGMEALPLSQSGKTMNWLIEVVNS